MEPTVKRVLTGQDADATWTVIASSVSQNVDGHLSVGNHEDSDENIRQVNSSDDDADTVKEISEDGTSLTALLYEAGLEEIVRELVVQDDKAVLYPSSHTVLVSQRLGSLYFFLVCWDDLWIGLCSRSILLTSLCAMDFIYIAFRPLKLACRL